MAREAYPAWARLMASLLPDTESYGDCWRLMVAFADSRPRCPDNQPLVS